MMKMLLTLSISIFAMMTSVCSYALSSNDDEGTYSVVFKPKSTQGELDGCMLEYVATYKDHAYHHGSVYVISGFIGVHFIKDSLALVLKAGSAKLDAKIKIEEPYFTFAKTKNISTARFKGKSATGDNNFKLSVFSLFENLEVVDLIESMTSEKSISIGYNLRKGGMDVVVPIDLTVKDTTITNDRGYVRVNSDEMLGSFVACYSTLLDKQVKVAEKIIGNP
jgi:hypothetical protein